MAHVVTTVAANLQRTRIVTFVIYDVHTHHVAIAETVVVDSGYGKLVDVA